MELLLTNASIWVITIVIDICTTLFQQLLKYIPIKITANCCFFHNLTLFCFLFILDPSVLDMEQINKVAEILPMLLKDEKNCIQEVYIAVKTIDQLKSVRQKLLHKETWLSYSMVSQGNISVLNWK